jgi:hypothetical protein
VVWTQLKGMTADVTGEPTALYLPVRNIKRVSIVVTLLIEALDFVFPTSRQ